MGVRNRKMGKTEQEAAREIERKVRGAFPPQRGQKTRPIMERPFQRLQLQDAPSLHRVSMQPREGEGERDREREMGRSV